MSNEIRAGAKRTPLTVHCLAPSQMGKGRCWFFGTENSSVALISRSECGNGDQISQLFFLEGRRPSTMPKPPLNALGWSMPGPPGYGGNVTGEWAPQHGFV